MSIESYIESALSARATGNKEEFISDCPSCGAEQKFYTNVKNGLMYCMRCSYGLNLVQLIMEVENVSKPKAIQKAARIQVGAEDASKLMSSFDAFVDLLMGWAPVLPVSELELPKYSVPITHQDATDGMAYLRGRGFGAQHVSVYNLQYVAHRDEEAPRFHRHIIFPEYVKGRLVYFTTRAAYDPPKGVPKSYHPKGISKSYLFGVGVALRKKRSVVIVVEGPLDAVAVPTHAVAALAKRLTDAQARLLADKFQHVAVCFDQGAEQDTIEAAQKLRAFGCEKTSTIKCPWDDPATGVQHRPKKTARDLFLRMRRFRGQIFENNY